MPEPGSRPGPHSGVILVATDLHDLSRLMTFALAQASESGSRLILLHVLASTAAISADAAGLPYYDTIGVLEFADQALLPWCEQARRQGVTCDALVREGNPAQQIAAAARQFQADCVLLGTRSRSKLSKLLLGSVAEQVLRSVYLPVITVGPEAHLPVDESGDRIVLHATTLRETSRPSAALACRIATERNARLVLLHVLPPIEEVERRSLPPGMDEKAFQELRVLDAEQELRLLARETGAGCCTAVNPVVVEGNPSIEILAEASTRNAGLIVLGSTDRSALGNMTRDRTIYRILAHARCPVITLREHLETAAEAHAEPAASAHR